MKTHSCTDQCTDCPPHVETERSTSCGNTERFDALESFGGGAAFLHLLCPTCAVVARAEEVSKVVR